MVRLNDDLMEALHAVRSLNLTNWSIAAGAVRSAVWDQLHGYTVATPLDDIDVVYFNAEVLPENDQTFIIGFLLSLARRWNSYRRWYMEYRLGQNTRLALASPWQRMIQLK